MKMQIALVLSFALFSAALGWTSREQVEVDPEKCVSSDPNVGTLKVGISTLPDSCVRATCRPGMIDLAGCGVGSVGKPCYMSGEDLSKPYPECCPRPVCPA
ncbi:hypothetical protein PPYR_11804 [Photinus pyralis]|uniref:Single domain-containing protein n=2 Tax=Photinus pyralis TaxID=7054 RepID=A0A5N4ACB5_PHOPY|nr:uncharacterized protein LOC116176290 [Photinus pyralis]KAB0794965.1 hypothetical protein PPYR_11804 [Photinus pyralis]